MIHLWNAIHHNNAQIDHCGTKDKGSFSFHMKTTSTNQTEFECKTFERATLHANCSDYRLIYKFISAKIYFITVYYCIYRLVLYIFYLSIFDTFDQIWNIYSSEKLMQTPRWAHGKQLLCELTFTFSHICRGPCENFPRKNQPRKKLVKKGSSFRIKSKLCVTSSEFLMCIAWRASQQHPRLNSKPLYFLFILGYVYPASLK